MGTFHGIVDMTHVDTMLNQGPNKWEFTTASFNTDIPYLNFSGSPFLYGHGDICDAHCPREFITLDDLEICGEFGVMQSVFLLQRCDFFKRNLAMIGKISLTAQGQSSKMVALKAPNAAPQSRAVRSAGRGAVEEAERSGAKEEVKSSGLNSLRTAGNALRPGSVNNRGRVCCFHRAGRP